MNIVEKVRGDLAVRNDVIESLWYEQIWYSRGSPEGRRHCTITDNHAQLFDALRAKLYIMEEAYKSAV